MAMSKKDYEAFAREIASWRAVKAEAVDRSRGRVGAVEEARLNGERYGLEIAARAYARLAKAGNDRFDDARFLRACGIGEE